MDVTGDSLCFTSARELAAMITSKQVSVREVMAAHLRQIERLNPGVNAIVSKLDDASCLALAEAADRQMARGDNVGPLHGLPTAFKDLESATGFPWTRGSPIFANVMATDDSAIVSRIREAGAIPIGKTNVPEFGMGSHTYNQVFGTTLNPYDTSKSAGGSSGGAAAALASGMLPIADGGDLGGSLRNPANFNNVVALRPSVGLVPNAPVQIPFVGVGVKGPMARSVADVAFLLSIVAGQDVRDPQSFPSPPHAFAGSLDWYFTGARVAWCLDLGGLPLDPRVRKVLNAQRQTFVDLGCIVEDACPDLGDADEIFITLRSWASWNVYGPLLATHRARMKPEAIWEIETGAGLTGDDLARALMKHGQLLERLRVLQQTYEFIVCAVNQVPPFDAREPWPRSINGVAMENYISWMKTAYWISTTCRPAISVPAGFTDEGLPVGVQIVGRYRDDLSVLKLAYAFEQATGFGKRRPPEA
ncbi:MAG TPA: amidase [Vicinamibacterales bacterium]|nr:amidase [Vicinamibacterales bacterium]